MVNPTENAFETKSMRLAPSARGLRYKRVDRLRINSKRAKTINEMELTEKSFGQVGSSINAMASDIAQPMYDNQEDAFSARSNDLK